MVEAVVSLGIKVMKSACSHCAPIIFTTSDIKNVLEARRDKLKAKCSEISLQISGSRTHSAPERMGGERMELTRLLGIETRQLNELQNILNHLEVVEPAKSAHVVAIGTIATIQRYDENGDERGNPETYYVGGYGSTDTKTSPPTVSYDSIILAPLMGKGVDGESHEIRIGNGETQYVELLTLGLPKTTARRPQDTVALSGTRLTA